MKVVITNVVLSNSGDAAIALGLVEALHKCGAVTADSDITILDSNADATSALYPHLNVYQQPASLPAKQGRYWRRAVQPVIFMLNLLAWRFGRRCHRSVRAQFQAIDNCDLIVSTGGTYLVEHYRVWVRLVDLIFSGRGKPLILWTQSMGPFKKRTSRLGVRLLIRIRKPYVMLRDERSRTNLLQVAPAAACAVYADVAFVLGAPERSGRDDTALISVRTWPTTIDSAAPFDPANYEHAMARAGELLAGAGLAVTAVSTCQGLATYDIDDSAYADQIFANSAVHVDREFHTPAQLMDYMANARIVVATRMHMAIMALRSGCQVIAIAYEFKTLELFRNMGLGDACIEMSDVTTAWVEAQINRALADSTYARLDDSGQRVESDRACPVNLLEIASTIGAQRVGLGR